MELRNRVKEIRRKKRLTQEELGEKVGVSRQTIISIEKYKYNPSIELGLKLSMELKTRVEDLFYFEES